MQGKRVPRLAFYSHDTMGLGHIRRNILLTDAILKAVPQTEVLLINGVHESGNFYLPKGADFITLPSYFKNPEGDYFPRSLGGVCVDWRRYVAVQYLPLLKLLCRILLLSIMCQMARCRS